MNYRSKTKILKDKLDHLNSEATYILKPKVFENEYDLLLGAFKKYYNDINIAYSFKTNYIPDFLNIVKNKKGYAEVVSIMELELASKVGFPYRNIFFNGPFKHKEETSKYLKLGVLVNIDSYDEFKWIEEFANRSKVVCRIGIRLNFSLIDSPSRFGIDVKDEIVEEIFRRSKSSKYLSLESLHFHYASRKVSAWEICTMELVSFLSAIGSKSLKDLKFISLGGGIYSRMDKYLKDQLPFVVPSFNEYADSSIKFLSDFLKKQKVFKTSKLEILIEPGTALASKSLDFVAKVVSIKKIKDISYINTTGSKYNMNPSPNRINSPLKILNLSQKNSVKVKNAKLCGYTCIESDLIHDDFSGKIAVGDLIVFKEVGSYSVVMKPPFILPDVPIIQFENKRKKFQTVRNKQTFNDIFSNFEFFN